jgi:hypothetical protein
MKKLLVGILLVAAAGCLFAESGSGFAVGAGATALDLLASPLDAYGFGAVVSVDVPGVPLRFGLSAFDFIGMPLFALSVDYLLVERRGAGLIGWYAGVGELVLMLIDSGEVVSWLGVRVSLGIRAWPAKDGRLEVFFELAPAWTPFVFESDGFSFWWQYFWAQPSLGMRYRF